MSKFKIVKETPAYEPEKKTEPAFLVENDLSSDTSRKSDSSRKLYFRPKAFNRISEHIGWDKKTEENVVEQGGILLGNVFFDEKKNLTYGIVEEAIAGEQAKGSAAYLEMNHEVWKDILDKLDDLVDKEKKDYQLIGWYHTHPNNLSVFMSGTDMGTQRKFFYHDWQFAVVMNPHKTVWKAFYGSDATECYAFVIKD